MARFVVFVRGINVGGIVLKMAQFKKILEDSGFINIKT